MHIDNLTLMLTQKSPEWGHGCLPIRVYATLKVVFFSIHILLPYHIDDNVLLVICSLEAVVVMLTLEDKKLLV